MMQEGRAPHGRGMGPFIERDASLREARGAMMENVRARKRSS